MFPTEPKKIALMYVKIIIGGFIYAFGFRLFLYDKGLLNGGTSSIAMIIIQFVDYPIGMVTIALNIPIFIFAWKKLGLKFMIHSFITMVLTSNIVDILGFIPFTVTDDIILSTLYGGILKGIGLGLVYSTGVATGGGDVTVRVLRRKYPYVNLGTIMMCIDTVVVMIYAVMFEAYDKAMYTMISMYVCSTVIDIILYGSLNAKLCYIITDYSDEVQKAVLSRLNIGITLLDGHGAYSGKNKQVIMCTAKKSQMVDVRNVVRTIDPDSFLIITDARSVYGRGFGDIMSND